MTIQAMELGFAALTILMAALVIAAVRHAGGSRAALFTGTGIAVWLTVTALLAHRGLLARFDIMPPALVRLLIPTGVTTVVLGLTGWGRRLVVGLPLWVLVASQAFRIPVELLLLGLHKAGGLPVQMTFEGGNFDIATGLTALVVAWRLRRAPAPRLTLGWNLLGFGLLVTIVAIANLSAPTPFRQFHNEPSSALVATAPLIWLPVFLVQLALLGHVLVFRKLSLEAREASGRPVSHGTGGAPVDLRPGRVRA